MGQLTKILDKAVKQFEAQGREQAQKDPYRLHFHLMPPVGWLNDPNGLCQYQGDYHVFFQYSPSDCQGGLKLWGHYCSGDLLHWEYLGAPLLADTPWDCHGVYSGSALVLKDGIHLYYTGNIKLEDRDYDYIQEGREAWTLHTFSKDGETFGPKKVALSPREYPSDYTCHIRDPKVWQEKDRYYMIQGGRRKDEKGAVLLYTSCDGENWEFNRELTTEEPFGYMWECPDLFPLGDRQVLSFSPQGLTRENYRYQNVYQSGYFLLKKDWREKQTFENFREWDYGFDFYAPQTFQDEKGRRILVGWMGMPDSQEEYTNPLEGGWQHALTVPREIILQEGKVLQYPMVELEDLRGEQYQLNRGQELSLENPCFDLLLERQEKEEDLQLILSGTEGSCTLSYKEGVFKVELDQAAGRGRQLRQAHVEKLEKLRVLADTSALEIYLNDGETVFTTRWYPGKDNLRKVLLKNQANACLWVMDSMEVRGI